MSADIKVATENIPEQQTSVLLLGGHLDTTVVGIVNEKIEEILKGDSKKVIVDLKELNYVSSAGLRLLLFLAKKMKGRDGVVLLCAVSDNIRKVLEVSGMSRFLPIHADRAAAMAASST